MNSPNRLVDQFFQNNQINNKSVLCAISGGADSVFLLYSLIEIREKYNIKIYAAHIDHGLRPDETYEEKKLVKNICSKFKVTLFFKRLSGKKAGDSGIEEWAREERYKFFQEIKEKESIDFIATGHTLDDQAETLFMRIGRGSGIKALAGIKPFREDNVIRPILNISKNDILDYLNAHNISWCEDSSNMESVYTRNSIRNDLFPLIEKLYPEFKKRLFYLSQQVSDLQEVIDPPVSLWCIAHIGEHDNREFKLSKPLDLNNRLIASEGIFNIFKEYGIAVDRLHVEEFLDNSSRSSGEFLLPGGWRYYPCKESVHITCKSENETQISKSWLNVPGETLVGKTNMLSISLCKVSDSLSIKKGRGEEVFVDNKKIKSLYIRSIEKKDVFTPFGSDTCKNIQKYLKKQGLNEHERRSVLVVCNEADQIVWLPNIIINDDFKVDKFTESALKLKITIS